jgi:predicted NBD/HSP70 family sugar kinase
VLVDKDVNIMALGDHCAYWPEHDNFLFIELAIGPGIVAADSSSAAATCSAAAATAAALRQAGRDLGDVLSTVVNLLNPSVIVIGGSLGQAGEHLMAGVREVVYRRSPPLATTHLRIGLSMAGDQSAILGASQMVTQYVLSPAAIEATLQDTG